MHTPTVELEEEEHVEPSEPERLDSEEVARDDRCRVGTQESAPAESSARLGGWQAGLAENLGDARRRDPYADTCELTDDPLVPPAWVLAGKAQHQLAAFFRERGPTWSPSAAGPPSPHKPAMPTQ